MAKKKRDDDFPEDLKDHSNDYVTYTAIEKKKEHDRENAACYSAYYGKLGTVGVLCKHPADRICIAPEVYLRWMELCKLHGIVPKEAEAYVENEKNYLRIPEAKYDRHVCYAAICCYRWTTHLLRMVWKIVKDCERSDITFWQALHFGLANHVAGTGHSFSSIVCPAVYSNNSHLNLAHSLAFKPFFEKSVEERKKITGQTVNAIAEISSKLGTQTSGPPKIVNKYPVPTFVYSLGIESVDELLTDKWTPLYRIENPTKETLADYYNSVKKGLAAA